MATFFSKLFRTKKKSQENPINTTKKPTAPSQKTLDQLDPSNDQDLETLVKTVKNLQKNADKINVLQKIQTLPQALAFATGSSQESFPELAEKIQQLLKNAQSNGEITQSIDQETRIAIVPWLKDEAFIDQLLADLKDQKELCKLAINGRSSKVRQIAAGKVEEEERLKEIQKQAKGKDKKVYQLTKDKLNTIKAEQEEKRKVKASIDTLISQIETHANTEANKLYAPKLEALSQQWSLIVSEASTTQVEKIAGLLIQAKEKARVLREKQQQADRQEAQIVEQKTEREATLLVIEQTIESLKTNETHNQANLSALDAVIKTQENRWLEATRESDVSKQDQKQYQNLMRELKHWQNATTKCTALPEDITKLLTLHRNEDKKDTKLSNKDASSLNNFLEQVSWPVEYPKPSVLKEIKNLLGDHHTAKEKLSSDIKKLKQDIEKNLSRLEQALEDKQLKNSRNILKETNRILRAMSPTVADNFKAKVQLLGAQVEDLKDWQGYAAQPKQLELCEKMESLTSTNLDPQTKADQIKALQTEWKKLGGSSDQAIWQRFKLAADNAFEPCKQFFDEQRHLKQANLQKRETICNELTQYLEENNWQSPDWKAVEHIGKMAREEWKQAFPVDFREGKKLQGQFNTLLDRLDSFLNEERTKNETAKKAIVSQAEQLLTAEDLKDAINSAKRLQKEWTQIGITRYGEDRKMWKAFRAACDQIFGQRDVEKQKLDTEKSDLICQAEEICKQAESLTFSDTDADLKLLKNLQKSLIELPIGSKEISPYKSRLSSRIKDAARENEKQHLENFKNSWKSILKSLESGEKLTESMLEELSLNPAINKQLINKKTFDALPSSIKECCILLEITCGIDSPVEDREARMQVQVQRLSAGMKNAESPEGKLETVEQILVHWAALSSENPDEAKSHQSRIIGAMHSVDI